VKDAENVCARLDLRADTLTGRIRDKSHLGRGFSVQLFDDNRLTFAWRCPRESNARFVAASLRHDHLRNGWTESGSARREHV
jgi:hypothetical protein